MNKGEFSVPNTERADREEAAMPSHGSPESSRADLATQKQRATLMAIDGVEGVGTGQDAIGNEAIIVYVRDQDAAKRVPPTVDGKKVVVQVTGPIDALKR